MRPVPGGHQRFVRGEPNALAQIRIACVLEDWLEQSGLEPLQFLLGLLLACTGVPTWKDRDNCSFKQMLMNHTRKWTPGLLRFRLLGS